MKKQTPKNFILQLGSLIALYVTITSILILIFNVTNLAFPDATAYYGEDNGARQAVRTSIALLLVFFPTYLIFTRLSNQDRRKHTNGTYSVFAKWLVYLSILGGILILLGDMVTLINYFLNGEITTRFLIKVGALVIVVGLTLWYYILDVRDYFKNKTYIAFYFGTGATILISTSLLYGYTYIETPSEVRQIRLDERQVNDLRDIYWKISEAYRATQTLPVSIEELYQNQKLPTAPDGRPAYTYNILDEKTFELCATFVANSPQYRQDAPDPTLAPPDAKEAIWYQNDNWEHGTGETCFKRFVQTFEKPVSLNSL